MIHQHLIPVAQFAQANVDNKEVKFSVEQQIEQADTAAKYFGKNLDIQIKKAALVVDKARKVYDKSVAKGNGGSAIAELELALESRRLTVEQELYQAANLAKGQIAENSRKSRNVPVTIVRDGFSQDVNYYEGQVFLSQVVSSLESRSADGNILLVENDPEVRRLVRELKEAGQASDEATEAYAAAKTTYATLVESKRVLEEVILPLEFKGSDVTGTSSVEEATE